MVGYYTNKENIKKQKFGLAKAVKIGSKSAIAEHYGDVLYKLDKKEEALKYWHGSKRLPEGGSEFLDKKIVRQKTK